MKKITLFVAAALMVAGTTFAQDKACCKKKGEKCSKEEAACCKKKGNKSSDKETPTKEEVKQTK